MTLTPYEIQILNEVYDYIKQNFTGTIYIDRLAKSYKISETTLCNAFKYLHHKTINQHRLETCMQKGKEMLQNGQKIKTVAEALGYSSSSSFSKTYRKVHFVLSKNI